MATKHTHAVFGEYRHIIEVDRWWSDVSLPSLGYVVRIFGDGDSPTVEQIDVANKISSRLHELIKVAGLERTPLGPIPASWEMRLREPQIEAVSVFRDGSASLHLEGVLDGQYIVAPLIECSADLEITFAGWST